MMSWSQPKASRQFSKPCRIWINSLVVSTRFATSRPLSVAGLECGKPNLCAVKPAGSAFTFCAQSRHDALSSTLRGAAWSYTRTFWRNLPPKLLLPASAGVYAADVDLDSSIAKNRMGTLDREFRGLQLRR